MHLAPTHVSTHLSTHTHVPNHPYIHTNITSPKFGQDTWNLISTSSRYE